MTEERLEQLVEGAAGRFDRSMNRAWEHRPVRLMGGALSLLTGAGLIAKAVPLAQEGRAARFLFLRRKGVSHSHG